MFYNANSLTHSIDGDILRSYLEVPSHYLESIGIRDGSPIKLVVDPTTNSIIITLMERPHNE